MARGGPRRRMRIDGSRWEDEGGDVPGLGETLGGPRVTTGDLRGKCWDDGMASRRGQDKMGMGAR